MRMVRLVITVAEARLALRDAILAAIGSGLTPAAVVALGRTEALFEATIREDEREQLRGYQHDPARAAAADDLEAWEYTMGLGREMFRRDLEAHDARIRADERQRLAALCVWCEHAQECHVERDGEPSWCRECVYEHESRDDADDHDYTSAAFALAQLRT